MIKAANLAVRFLLEFCALAALGYWGFAGGRGPAMQALLGLGVPLLTAVIWGVFVSPKASIPLPLPARLLVELLVFGLAAAALIVAGRPALGWALAGVALVNAILLSLLGQR